MLMRWEYFAERAQFGTCPGSPHKFMRCDIRFGFLSLISQLVAHFDLEQGMGLSLIGKICRIICTSINQIACFWPIENLAVGRVPKSR
jgi:hypothetical protein